MNIELRWLADPRTDAVPPVLQYRMFNIIEGGSVGTNWQTVPTVIEPPTEAKTESKPK